MHSQNATVRRVLSSAKIGTASWRYYQFEVATSAGDYYAAEGEAPGRWYGSGLDSLGLDCGGVVGEAALEALFARALHPTTGNRLGRQWRSDGVTGFDLCFSAPKSVSALWAIGGADVARQVAAAHAAAVRAGLDYLETHAAVSRIGRDGLEQTGTAGFSAAIFDHRTSRAGDPQLHSHALVLNKVRCADGLWRSIDGHEIYHHKKAAGTLYQAALSAELTRRLGPVLPVAFERPNQHGQAEIAGISAELTRLWSKRAAAIDADAAPVIARFEDDLGRPLTPAERARVVKTSVLKTRPAKTHSHHGVLQQRWADEADQHGWTPHRLWESVAAAAAADRLARRQHSHQMNAMDRALAPLGHSPAVVEWALQAVAARSAVFSRADLAAEIAAQLPNRAASAARVREQVEMLTAQAVADPEAVEVGTVRDGVTDRASDTRWTTRTHLAIERRILTTAIVGRTAGAAGVPESTAAEHSAAYGLDGDQQRAVEHLLGAGHRIDVLIAPAGAGKTRTVGAAAAAWRAAGHQVVGLAPSARAAAELSAATGDRAETVAKWLHEQDERDHRSVSAATVLVVDEASMLATTDLAALTDTVQARGAKLVLVGDPAQIGPVQRAGGLLADLARRTGSAELTAVHRFAQPWEAHASQLLRRGEPTVLDAYARRDRIHPAADADAALDTVHARWYDALHDGHDALMMARSRADVDALNHRARTAAQTDGTVAGPVLAHAGGRDWQTGDLLRARRNDRRLTVGDTHVRNGDRYRVLAAAPDGGLVVDDMTDRGRTILPAAYLDQHATYGWASTIDGAQGATADVGILLARPGLDREHLYVAMTRGRHANHVHVTGTTGDPEHAEHRPVTAPVATLDDAVKTLQAAAVRVGAEQSALSLLEQPRGIRRGAASANPPLPSPAALRRQAELASARTPRPRHDVPPQPERSRSLSR